MPRPTIAAAVREVLLTHGLDTLTPDVERILRETYGIRLDRQRGRRRRVADQRQYLRDRANGSTMVRTERITGP